MSNLLEGPNNWDRCDASADNDSTPNVLGQADEWVEKSIQVILARYGHDPGGKSLVERIGPIAIGVAITDGISLKLIFKRDPLCINWHQMI